MQRFAEKSRDNDSLDSELVMQTVSLVLEENNIVEQCLRDAHEPNLT